MCRLTNSALCFQTIIALLIVLVSLLKPCTSFLWRTTTRTYTRSSSFHLHSFSTFTILRPRRPMTATATAATTTTTDPLRTMGLPTPLLLGSASFTRKLILKEMGVNFHIVVRPIDEKSLGDRSKDKPSDLVLTLAKAKMDHLVNEIQAGRCQDDLPALSSLNDNDNDRNRPSWVVLTGDQVVTCDDSILEKPESIEQAKDFVSRYVKHPPSTVGSVVLTHLPSGIQVSGVDTATIHFRADLPADDLIERLLQDEEGKIILSCAGGLMVEHPFVKEYIERIDGTEDSVMGLSKDLVLRLLKELKEKLNTAGVEH